MTKIKVESKLENQERHRTEELESLRATNTKATEVEVKEVLVLTRPARVFLWFVKKIGKY